MKLTLLFFSLTLQSVPSEGAQHMQAGVEAHKQSRFDAEFRKATEADPNLLEAFLNLGEVYMETHNYVAAIAPLKRALELNPELDAAHLQLGYALLSQGSAAEAIPHLERVHALEALGIAQIETGQYQEAIAKLSAALVKRPNDPDLLYYLGRASGLLSKQAIDTLLSAYPDSARAHQAMGENYFVLRQMPQAEKEYSEALRQRPDIPGLQLELGLVYAGAAQWSKAEEAFRAETRRQPGNAEAAYRLGAVLLQQGARALIVGADTFFTSQRSQIAVRAARHSLPNIWVTRVEVEAGGLMCYGANIPGVYRQAGVYVGRILKGAKPADLPVQLPTAFDLIINLQTAKALGLTLPPTLLARADEVIE